MSRRSGQDAFVVHVFRRSDERPWPAWRWGLWRLRRVLMRPLDWLAAMWVGRYRARLMWDRWRYRRLERRIDRLIAKRPTSRVRGRVV